MIKVTMRTLQQKDCHGLRRLLLFIREERQATFPRILPIFRNIFHLCLLMICSTDSSSSFSWISPRARFSLSSGESVHADLNSTGCSNKHTKLDITGCFNKHTKLDITGCFNKHTNLTGSSNKHALL